MVLLGYVIQDWKDVRVIKWRKIFWVILLTKPATPLGELFVLGHVRPHLVNKRHDVHSTFPSSDRFCVHFQSAGSTVTYTRTRCVCRDGETPVGAGGGWKGSGWATLRLRNWLPQKKNKTYAQVFSWRKTYKINEIQFTGHILHKLCYLKILLWKEWENYVTILNGKPVKLNLHVCWCNRFCRQEWNSTWKGCGEEELSVWPAQILWALDRLRIRTQTKRSLVFINTDVSTVFMKILRVLIF